MTTPSIPMSIATNCETPPQIRTWPVSLLWQIFAVLPQSLN